MTKVKKTGCPPPCVPPGKRGSVEGLSVASGLRLQQAVASVDPGHGHPLWITLTYPADWPGNWQIWKKHLDNFRRSLYDQAWVMPVGAIWRLEAQRRGAPHYHILLWAQFDKTMPKVKEFRQWMSKAWYRIVKSGDEKHLKAGTQCVVIDSGEALQGVMHYLGKYVGKSSVHPESQCFNQPVGRYWGVWNKEELLLDPQEVELNKDQFCKARRVLTSYKKSKSKAAGYKKRRNLNGRNGAPSRQKSMPGTRCFVEENIGTKILNYVDPIPF